MIARQSNGWTYDPRLKGSGYRNTNTGQVMSREAVRDLVVRAVSGSQGDVGYLAGAVAGGAISPSEWYNAMREEIKDSYISQYLTGIGGRDVMTQADWGSVGGMIADQYRYLEGFYAEVKAGDMSAEAIAARANMYINSSREAFERAQAKANAKRTKEHKWARTPAESCDDCIALEALDWQPVDEPFIAPSSGKTAIPGNGATICLTNCKCYIDYKGQVKQ
jgi:hypothetical protein